MNSLPLSTANDNLIEGSDAARAEAACLRLIKALAEHDEAADYAAVSAHLASGELGNP